MKLIIKKSMLGGLGSFAPNNIKKGSRIKTLSGEKVSLEEIRKRISERRESVDDPLQIDERLYLDLDEDSRLINHSCNPNAGIRGVSELFAIRDIKSGEEITFDYSTTVGKTITGWFMGCNCGYDKCRKQIGNVLTIPREVLSKYKKLGALPDFIKNQLSIQLKED